jgi:hypothetical protein
MTATFAVLCLVFVIRFAFPQRFQSIAAPRRIPPDHRSRNRRFLGVCGDWRRQPDEYRDDAVWAPAVLELGITAVAPWSRGCTGFLAAAYLALVGVPQAPEEASVRTISSAIVWGDHDAADEVMRTLRDPDAEIVVRRLVVMVTSEGCREVLHAQRYDAEGWNRRVFSKSAYAGRPAISCR